MCWSHRTQEIKAETPPAALSPPSDRHRHKKGQCCVWMLRLFAAGAETSKYKVSELSTDTGGWKCHVFYAMVGVSVALWETGTHK